jgi:hypothetical protein
MADGAAAAPAVPHLIEALEDVVLLDYISLEIKGFQIICGPYASPSEAWCGPRWQQGRIPRVARREIGRAAGPPGGVERE